MTDRPDEPERPEAAQPPPSWGPQPPPPPPPAPGYGAPAYGSEPGYGNEPAYGTPPGQAPAYGPAPGYGPPPYGHPSYGTPAGYRAPETPEQSSIRTQAIIALVINAFVVLSTCFAALPSIGGAITAGIAIGQVGSDPENARRLVKWSWGLLIATIVIGVLIVVGFVLLVAIVGSGVETTSDATTTGI